MGLLFLSTAEILTSSGNHVATSTISLYKSLDNYQTMELHKSLKHHPSMELHKSWNYISYRTLELHLSLNHTELHRPIGYNKPNAGGLEEYLVLSLHERQNFTTSSLITNNLVAQPRLQQKSYDTVPLLFRFLKDWWTICYIYPSQEI